MGDVPDRVFRAVDVWQHLDHADHAFRKLDAGRVWMTSMAGASPVRISEAEKWHYAHGRGLAETLDEYEQFVYLIDAMDDEFMTWYGEQHTADATSNETIHTTTDDADDEGTED